MPAPLVVLWRGTRFGKIWLAEAVGGWRDYGYLNVCPSLMIKWLAPRDHIGGLGELKSQVISRLAVLCLVCQIWI